MKRNCIWIVNQNQMDKMSKGQIGTIRDHQPLIVDCKKQQDTLDQRYGDK